MATFKPALHILGQSQVLTSDGENTLDSVFKKLVSKVMFELKLGKAPDANRLTAEHLIRAHPILPLANFFS